jgi:undecaprenyl diphosphate synthase
VNPKAEPLVRLPDVPPSRIPRHIAIIMDGNGRWAKERGLPRRAGHKAGALAVRAAVEECGKLGVEALTLYSFSLENWKRPREEIEALMALYLEYMRAERELLVKHNMRFRQIGRREGLPPEALAELDLTLEATKNCTGPTLCLAVNYGSRAEITDAVRAIARRVAQGELAPDAIDEAALSAHLDTAGLPDPDLLIRTAGEMRISNYLLWQISYSELHVTPTLWPDFRAEHLHAAVRDFASRRRRFGGLDAETA